ncbi:hypothetical protein [Caulobacter sp. 17J80-11]|uniref:hypothetical protein n=1 Tax=Caulobacter sp. 17J80-11 TaxID=2763502 RepID=UPI0016536D5C|nr:hypothetical protein [Caulobacter sp. 17J80-11]MBC6982798.1 hypothetical protein [Caulobacter sp. 17J80-11]
MRRLTLALTAGLALGLVVADPALAARKPRRGRGEAAQPAEPPKPKVLTVAALVGADETAVKGKLGEPVLSRAEGAGALWTYRLPDCALFVYFKREGMQPLKVSGASSGPLARGGTTPEPDACLALAGVKP